MSHPSVDHSAAADSPRTRSQPRFRFPAWLPSALLALGLAAAIWAIQSRAASRFLFVATARISISPRPVTDPAAGLSRPQLQAVVEALDLPHRWTLPADTCVDRLRANTRIRPFQNTSLFEVSAASADPMEAAELANSLAKQIIQDLASRLPPLPPGVTGQRASPALVDQAQTPLRKSAWRPEPK